MARGTMNSKQLSQTGISIPEIGLGTWNYHGVIELLRAGFEQGALWIDTAESYGSCLIIGGPLRCLPDGGRSGVTLLRLRAAGSGRQR